MAFGHLTDLSPDSQTLPLVMLYHILMLLQKSKIYSYERKFKKKEMLRKNNRTIYTKLVT